MKISAITGVVFSILILDLLFYGIFYDIEKHGYIPSRFITQYQNFMGFFLNMAIILAILFALALVKDLIFEDRPEV
ncbi:MAG: hypothetical protein M1351_06545 [Candidatus Thermoplasmatota archaeon]|jgi:hypothetical protein|nr:hypothetical protein [Candidatus Sysuiplasma jiujiangense]MBX8642646.1 hypothetical protein [Candidatus Sysuiplasma jiujiangense]MCL5253727.1 hypothetical protein [Candidatus Thermoplasmatota archaeon]